VQSLVEPPVYDGKKLAEVLGWADVLILLSDFEGVPLSILEAQRLGVVVIATNVGGVPEIIESGRNGFLVSLKGAVEETLDALKTLMEDDALRSRIALAASDVADWPQTTKELVTRLGLPPVRGAASG
jgi:glycosyltransferase involved in cell wall biosynthesis